MLQDIRRHLSRIATIQKLRRAARKHVADLESADILVERTLRTALDDVDRYLPEGRSTEQCLVQLLENLAAHKPDMLH